MKILNFGSLNIDNVYNVKDFVQPGETILSLGYNIFCGGKGLNQSVALAKAGADVYHAGAIGADGAPLLETLQEAGVHTEFLRQIPGPSGHTVIEINQHGQNCIIVTAGSNGKITPADVDEVLSHFESGDILLLQNEISSIPYIMEKAYAKGMKIALNPSPVNDALYTFPLETASWFILNETEGQLLAGCESEDEHDILAALHEKYPQAAIVLTLGSKGAWYSDSSVTFFEPARRVKAVDTTAAGDTFCGYLLACLAAGNTPQQAMSTATCASAIAVTRPGAAPSIPTMDEARAFHA